MKVMQVINQHRFRGGADVMAERTAALLTRNGHESILLSRDSRVLGRGAVGKARAFVSGMYSRAGRRFMVSSLRAHRPDLVHIHDVYPFFSPWVLRDCRREGVPVVMTCHDFRLTCPAATHLCGSAVCELCLGGHESWCVLRNCRASRWESLGYALRSAVARKWRLFLDNVTAYITPTEFVKGRLVAAGFPEQRITAVPNMIDVPESGVDPSVNQYVAYVGRITPEKGISTLLASAEMTGLRVRIAGDPSPMPELVKKAPANVEFLGPLCREDVETLYRSARFLVLPSLWFETFGLVAAEAMSHGVPVIASNMGGLPEVVDDGATGFLFEAGNPEDLANKMRVLWSDPALCRRMGQTAREKVTREYSEDTHYGRLMVVYETAIRTAKELRAA